MATVYKAEHLELRSLHALKVIKTPDPSAQERALMEARAQAALRHPNVLQISDLLRTEEGWPVLVLEYVEGENLAQRLQQGQLGFDEIDHIAEGVLSGVAAAHAAGLVHRDLKPSNVLLARREDGSTRPLVADFGIAKVRGSLIAGTPTQTGVMLGTPGYASPEQMVSARDVDHVSDIFSLGALLYCLVTSRLAFPHRDRLELLRAISHGKYTAVTRLRPDAPERMIQAIDLALRPERDRRVRSVRRLLQIWRGQRAVGVQPLPMSAPLHVSAEVVATELAPGEVASRSAPATPSSEPVTPGPSMGSWFGPRPSGLMGAGAPWWRRSEAVLPAVGVLLLVGVLGATRPPLAPGASPRGGVDSRMMAGGAAEEAPSSAAEEAPSSAAEDSAQQAGARAEESPPAKAAPPAASASRPAKEVAPRAEPAGSVTPPPAAPPSRVGVQARPTLIIREIVPDETPEPPAGYGQILLSGELTGYAKSSAGSRHALPGPLPPGTYDVHVRFGDRGDKRVGTFAVGAAEVLALRCAPQILSCR